MPRNRQLPRRRSAPSDRRPAEAATRPGSSRPPEPRREPAPLSSGDSVSIPRQEPIEQPRGARRGNFEEVSLGFDEERAPCSRPRAAWSAAKPACIEAARWASTSRASSAGRSQGLRRARRARSSEHELPARRSAAASARRRRSARRSACWWRSASRSPSAGWSASSPTASAEPSAIAPRSAAAAPARPARVAIVGSGPAGLTCAADLARPGLRRHRLRGAARRRAACCATASPSSGCPRQVLDREVRPHASSWAWRSRPTSSWAGTLTLDELFDEWGFDAVFLGTGAGLPDVPGHPRREPEAACTRPTSSSPAST